MSVTCVLAVWAGYVVGSYVGPNNSVIRVALAIVFVVTLWIAWRRERRMETLDELASPIVANDGVMDALRAAQARRTEAGS